MRTLILASPHERGQDVEQLQHQLLARRWLHGRVDGEYGPLTAQAVHRAKFWLGYAQPDQAAGDLLMAYLTGRRKQTPAMLDRVHARMHPPHASMQKRALLLLEGKLGVTEDPPGSNRCWASDWYGSVGPWCAMAACWSYASAGSRALTLPTVRRNDYAYVPAIVADARLGRNHLTITNQPQPGDLVCYDWPGESPGVADHVGLFEKWTRQALGELSAIEGNTSSDDRGSQSNGGGVFRRIRTRSLVQAFVHVGQ